MMEYTFPGQNKMMEYTVACIGTNKGWRYRVTLWCGFNVYHGETDYAHHRTAEKAAKRTGATLRDETTR